MDTQDNIKHIKTGGYSRFGLTLMVTHACNMRCRYCYNGPGYDNQEGGSNSVSSEVSRCSNRI
jgi:molybdenum cofactor biosynthesis enzyme MoaA